jgi:hypothetical protein
MSPEFRLPSDAMPLITANAKHFRAIRDLELVVFKP